MYTKIILGLFSVFLLMPTQAHAAESHWALFGQEKLFDHYYDQNNFMRNKENIIGVWVKVVPKTQEAIDDLLKSRRLRAFLMDGYEDYQFTVSAIEIDCSNKMRAMMESRDYGKLGRVLDKVGAVTRNWRSINPEDHPYAFYLKILCKKQANKKKVPASP